MLGELPSPTLPSLSTPHHRKSGRILPFGYLCQDSPSSLSSPQVLPGTSLGKSAEHLGKEWGCPATCPLPLGVGFCLSSLGPAASLGGGQACAWVAVSLRPPLSFVPQRPVSLCLAGVLSCRKACWLAGRPAASSLPEPQPFFFVLPSPGS